MKNKPTVNALMELGFKHIASWSLSAKARPNNSRLTYGPINDSPEIAITIKAKKALYAFVVKNEVKYIGKTTRSISSRFQGYKNPGRGQQTNIKCNTNICRILQEPQGSVSIFALIFGHDKMLYLNRLEFDHAAGLEQSFIDEFEPEWNGRFIAGRTVTESEENEKIATEPKRGSENMPPILQPMLSHNIGIVPQQTEIKLGKVYYRTGFMNIPGKQSHRIAPMHGAPISIQLGINGEQTLAKIDRRANLNGSPRIFGGKIVASWFQEHFNQGDVVKITIVNPNEIILELPHAAL